MFKQMLTAGCMVALGLAYLATSTHAGGKSEKSTDLQNKAEGSTSAVTINFAKDLDLGFPGLTSLGARIDQARMQGDPVGLATCARELKVAEQVSGKSTTIKSADLAKEAVELAKLRYNAEEIKAVAYTVGDKEAKMQLLDEAAKAREYQVAQLKAKESGEKTRGIAGRLHVDSRIRNSSIVVYVNGYQVGSVTPYGDSYFYIGNGPYENTHLYARSTCGCYTWRRTVQGVHNNFHWILDP